MQDKSTNFAPGLETGSGRQTKELHQKAIDQGILKNKITQLLDPTFFVEGIQPSTTTKAIKANLKGKPDISNNNPVPTGYYHIQSTNLTAQPPQDLTADFQKTKPIDASYASDILKSSNQFQNQTKPPNKPLGSNTLGKQSGKQPPANQLSANQIQSSLSPPGQLLSGSQQPSQLLQGGQSQSLSQLPPNKQSSIPSLDALSSDRSKVVPLFAKLSSDISGNKSTRSITAAHIVAFNGQSSGLDDLKLAQQQSHKYKKLSLDSVDQHLQLKGNSTHIQSKFPSIHSSQFTDIKSGSTSSRGGRDFGQGVVVSKRNLQKAEEAPTTSKAADQVMPQSKQNPDNGPQQYILVNSEQVADYQKIFKSQNKNNLYLQMTNELSLPYETNFQIIKEKLGLSTSQEKLGEMLFQQNSDIMLDKQSLQNLVLQSAGANASASAGAPQPQQQIPRNVNSAGDLSFKFKQFGLQPHTASSPRSPPLTSGSGGNRPLLLLQQQQRIKQQQLKNPSKRAEVDALALWLDTQMNRLCSSETELGMEELFQNTQLLFTACFRELTRQVSVDCQERGELLNRLWKSNTDLIRSLIKQVYNAKDRGEQSQLEEITRVHKMYQQSISLLEQDVEKFSTLLKEEEKKYESMRDNANYMKNHNQKLNSLLQAAKKEVQHYKDQYSHIKIQNNNMQKALEDLEEQIQQQKIRNQKKKQRHIQELRKQLQPTLSEEQRLLSQNDYVDENISDSDQEKQPSDPTQTQDKASLKFKQLQIPENDDGGGTQQLPQSQSSPVGVGNTNQFFQVGSSTNITKQQRQTTDSDDSQNGFDEYQLLHYIAHKSVDTDDLQQYVEEQNEQARLERLEKEKEQKKQMEKERLANTVGVQTDKYLAYAPTKLRAAQQQLDKETQTSDLDSKLEEQLRGIDIPGLAKLEDQLERSESAVEEEAERIQVQTTLREKLIHFIRLTQKHKNAAMDTLRNEIGLKIQYFNTVQSMKIETKESKNEKDDLERDNTVLREQLQQMQRKKDIFKALARKLQGILKEQNVSKEVLKNFDYQILENTKQLAQNLKNSPFLANILQKTDKSFQGGLSEALLHEELNSSAHLIDGGGEVLQTKHSDENHDEVDAAVLDKLKSGGSNRAIALPDLQKVTSAITSLIQMPDVELQQSDLQLIEAEDNQENQIIRAQELSGGVVGFVGTASNFRASTQLRKSKLSQGASTFKSLNLRTKPQRQSMNHTLSMQFIQSIRVSVGQKGNKQPKSLLPKKTVCKAIGNFYTERIKIMQSVQMQQQQQLSATSGGGQQKIPFHVLCYEHYFALFGLKMVAERKLKHFYQSILQLEKSSPRIRLFGRFLSLLDGFESDEVEFYLNTLDQFKTPADQAQGIQNIAQSPLEKILVPLEKCVAIFHKLEGSIPVQFFQQQLEEIYKNKVADKNKVSTQIDVDLFMAIYIESRNKMKSFNKKSVELLFSALDLNSDGTIELYEFMTIYYYVEGFQAGKDVDRRFVEDVFNTNCDFVNKATKEKVFSRATFIQVALDNEWYKQEKLDSFSQSADPADKIRNIAQLIENFEEIKQALKKRFYYAQAYNSFFQKAIKKLEENLASVKKDANTELTSWLMYRILDLESKRAVLLFEISNLVPPEFLCINYVNSNIEEAYVPQFHLSDPQDFYLSNLINAYKLKDDNDLELD